MCKEIFVISKRSHRWGNELGFLSNPRSQRNISSVRFISFTFNSSCCVYVSLFNFILCIFVTFCHFFLYTVHLEILNIKMNKTVFNFFKECRNLKRQLCVYCIVSACMLGYKSFLICVRLYCIFGACMLHWKSLLIFVRLYCMCIVSSVPVCLVVNPY